MTSGNNVPSVDLSIRFDLFELDVRNSELRRSGLPVDLPPQAMRILVLLVGRPNQLVLRREIKDALWPGQSHGDFDSRLNFAVKKLREVLGDGAEQPRYVQTVRNAGYRFIASVRTSEGRLIPEESPLLAKDARNGAPGASGKLLELSPRNEFLFRRATLVLALIAAAASAVSIAALVMRPRGENTGVGSGYRTPGAQAESGPEIYSVSPIYPRARQKIVIRGRGFGLHVSYVHTDSPNLAIRDETAHWAAGRMIPQNVDEVMVDVESWTDTEIVVSGFSGDYGVKGWELRPGDDVGVAVWNPQSGVGPAVYHVAVVDGGVSR